MKRTEGHVMMADEENDSLRAKIIHIILKYSPVIGNSMGIAILYNSKPSMIVFILNKYIFV